MNDARRTVQDEETRGSNMTPQGAPRVVILGGAGAMGRITTADLLRTSRGRLEVVVADRDLTAVRDQGAVTLETDVTNPRSLAHAVRGAFVVIASLPYRFNELAMRAALEAGAHYVDLGGLFHTTRRQLRLGPEFERAGCMAILGMGSAPGILNVMATHAAQGMEQVREIHCMVGARDSTRYRYLPPLGFGYSPDTLLDEFVKESAVFRAGEFRMVPAIDPGERIFVRFPAPVGRLAIDTTLHSEVATLPLSFADRGIREVTFRQAFEPATLDRLRFVVELGLAGVDPIPLAGGEVVPRGVLAALLARFPAPQPAGKLNRYEILRTRVVGVRNRRRIAVVADCHAGPRAGWGVGPDIDTGAPPAIAAQLLASGEIPLRPGVWAPEQAVPAAPFFRELERRGMRVHVRTER